LSTSPSRSPASWELSHWYPIRRNRRGPTGSRRRVAFDRWLGLAALGDHRGSDRRLGIRRRDRRRPGQLRRPGRLRRLGGPQSPPMMKLGLFSDRPVLRRRVSSESLGTFGLLGGCSSRRSCCKFDLGYSLSRLRLRILPIAAVLVVSAPLSPILARFIGVKLTVGGRLAAIAGRPVVELGSVRRPPRPIWISYLGFAADRVSGPAVLLPTATNSVLESGAPGATPGSDRPPTPLRYRLEARSCCA